MAERHGIRLIEVIVVVVIVLGVVAFFGPAVNSAREAGRRVQCANNMRNIGLALLNYATSKNRFPNAGTFFDDPASHGGDPAQSTIYRALTIPDTFAAAPGPLLHSWVYSVMPYFDASNVAFPGSPESSYLDPIRHRDPSVSNRELASVSIGFFECPDDRTLVPQRGNQSYVVNGGFARWYAIPVGWEVGPVSAPSHNDGILRWTTGRTMEESLAVGRKLGVMFLGTQTGDQPWDMKTTVPDITDGLSNTLLVGENTAAGYSEGAPASGGLPTNWDCPLPNFTMFLGSDDVCHSRTSNTDCLGGQLHPTPTGATGPGWAWANTPGSYERINAGPSRKVEGSFPFASSGHPGGCNFAFCDGSIRFIRETVDGTLYAKLITPGGTALPEAIRQTALQFDPDAL